MTVGPRQILVLAGSRPTADPLARQAGVPHKWLIPIDGIPMLDRVIDALQRLPDSPRIVVAADRSQTTRLSVVTAATDAGQVRLIPTAPSPSRTVLGAMSRQDIQPPFLLTTADHPLLTAEIIGHFWTRVPPAADAAAAVASAKVIDAAWPTRRTYHRFRDGRYSGCNLFAIMTPRAENAIAFWEMAEARRKRPFAMIRLLGAGTTARFLTGALSLQDAADRLGRRTGTQLAAIPIPFAEAAIDVDKADDLVLASRILQAREAASAPMPADMRP